MREKNIAYGIILSYISVALNVISGLLFTPFLIKSLGNSQYGVYEIITSLASNLSILNLGMSDCVVKFVSKYRTEDDKKSQGEVLGCVLKILIISAVIAAVISLFLYFRFENLYSSSLDEGEIILGKKLLVISSISLVLSLPGAIFSCVLIAYEKFAFVRGVSIVSVLLRMISVVVILTYNPSVVFLQLIDAIISIVGILLMLIIVLFKLQIKIRVHTNNRKMYKDIFVFSGYTIFFLIAKEVRWQTDKTIIGLRLNSDMVTIYAAGGKISGMFNQLGYTLAGMFLPRAIRMTEENSSEKEYREYMVEMARIIMFFVFGVLMAYIFLGNSFIFLWLGEGYELAFYTSLITMISILVPMLQDTGLAILKARDTLKDVAMVWFASAITNIVFTWILIQKFGIISASIVTLITSYGINVLGLNLLLKKEITFHIFDFFRDVFKGYIKIAFTVVIYFLVIKLLFHMSDSWAKFFGICIGYAVVYILSVYCFVLNTKDRKVVLDFVKRFFYKRKI